MGDIPDDGDAVKALGFLTLYTGNLEAAITDELRRIEHAKIMTIDPAARPLGNKIAELRKYAAHYAANHPPGAVRNDHAYIVEIIDALSNFNKHGRTPLTHGSIIGEAGSDKLTLTDNGKGTTGPITSAEIYEIANAASNLRPGVMHLRFVLKRHLEAL